MSMTTSWRSGTTCFCLYTDSLMHASSLWEPVLEWIIYICTAISDFTIPGKQ